MTDNYSEGRWAGIVAAVNTLHKMLRKKPKQLRIGHWMTPGSILNSYREGDLSFKQAVKELENWKKMP